MAGLTKDTGLADGTGLSPTAALNSFTGLTDGGSSPPPTGTIMITETGDTMISETGDTMIAEA